MLGSPTSPILSLTRGSLLVCEVKSQLATRVGIGMAIIVDGKR